MTPVADLLQIATAHHAAGNLPEARRHYEQVLAQSPDHALATFRIGLLELQKNRPQAAAAQIERAIALAPQQNQFQLGLGEVRVALREWDRAAVAYEQVLVANPQSAEAQFGLGSVRQAQGDLASAIRCFQAAAELQPDRADIFNNLGNCHQLLGNLEHAEHAYRMALAVNPVYGGALSNLGTVLQASGRIDQAIALFRSAATLEPGAAHHQVNLGAAFCEQGDFASAAATLGRAIELDPNHPEAAYNLGNALHGLGRQRESVQHYRRAVALRPNYIAALINLGNVHKELGEFKQGMAAFEAAIAADPNSIGALNNAGCLLRTLGRIEEAEKTFRCGLVLEPGNATLQNNLGNVLKDAGELEASIDCFRRAAALAPADWQAHSNLAYALTFSTADAQPILQECLRWNQRHATTLRSQIRSRGVDPTPHHRLRVGYVSPDFRQHCQSLFTIPLLSNHDHENFEVFCYSSVERPDDYTRRLASHADVWRDVRPLDDAALCEQIRADAIDILVDLTMHMAGARPLLFARRPAPIQVAWLAYPGTTGIETMDYRLSDPRLDPPGFEAHYSERTLRLPDSFWCYDPLTTAPAVNPLPALERGYVTFGCLNNPCKLTDATLALWSGVMAAMPTARLVLMAPPGSHRQHLLQRLERAGIASQRVEVLPFRPRSEYLRSYHGIDVGLDTVPYNGHTTSLDSMWMGVPVITRIGRTCAGRGGVSQLFQLDLLELAAEEDGAFVRAAVALADDLPRLAALRQQLRGRLERSPLMDAKRFARNIEAAYRQMARESGMSAPA